MFGIRQKNFFIDKNSINLTAFHHRNEVFKMLWGKIGGFRIPNGIGKFVIFLIQVYIFVP